MSKILDILKWHRTKKINSLSRLCKKLSARVEASSQDLEESRRVLDEFETEAEKMRTQIANAQKIHQDLERALEVARQEVEAANEITIPGLVAANEVLISRWEAEKSVEVARQTIAMAAPTNSYDR